MSGKPGVTRLTGGAKPQVRITAEAKEIFLKAVREGSSLKRAAELAGGYTASAFSTHLANRDPEFKAALQEASAESLAPLEDVMTRHAVEGWTEVERDGDGNVVRSREKWSPTPGIWMMKARNPAVYGDNARVELSGAVSGRLEVSVKHDFEGLLARAVSAGIIPAGDPAGDVHAAAAEGAERKALLPAPPD